MTTDVTENLSDIDSSLITSQLLDATHMMMHEGAARAVVTSGLSLST